MDVSRGDYYAGLHSASLANVLDNANHWISMSRLCLNGTNAVRVDADLQEGFCPCLCLCRWCKKSDASREALGRSRDGFSCKIHVLTDALGSIVFDKVFDRGQAGGTGGVCPPP